MIVRSEIKTLSTVWRNRTDIEELSRGRTIKIVWTIEKILKKYARMLSLLIKSQFEAKNIERR